MRQYQEDPALLRVQLAPSHWCVLRREFSGMIPVITSNFIIPATPSPIHSLLSKRTSTPLFGPSVLSACAMIFAKAWNLRERSGNQWCVPATERVSLYYLVNIVTFAHTPFPPISQFSFYWSPHLSTEVISNPLHEPSPATKNCHKDPHSAKAGGVFLCYFLVAEGWGFVSGMSSSNAEICQRFCVHAPFRVKIC